MTMEHSRAENGRPRAAVWWRVSTDDQRETSPGTQIAEAKQMALDMGFQVPEEHVLGTDWHSLTVWESPAMEQLKELISSGSIKAVFMYDPDRGPSKPVHRLLLRAMLEKYGIDLHCSRGQVPSGDMGEVMEFLSAWSKEKQVRRAQQGARDGLRDRARLRGLPTNTRPAFGYRWNGERFEPDPLTFVVAKRIWSLALEGVSIRSIAKLLTDDRVPSPGGLVRWPASTIAKILANPVYCGDYLALRTKATIPKHRRGLTYGKSSRVQRLPEDQIAIPGLITAAVVTLADFNRVQARLERNKAEGGRVVHRYLLRSRVRCEKCGRRWRGAARRGRGRIFWRYLCRGNEVGRGVRCDASSMNGPVLEERIWDSVTAFLSQPDVFTSALERQGKGSVTTARKSEQRIAGLERKQSKLRDADAAAYGGYARGITSEETYQRVAAELTAERRRLEQEGDRERQTLNALSRQRADSDAIKTLYPKLVRRIESAAWEDKRFVLDCLDAEATVGPSGIALSLAVPMGDVPAVSTTKGG